MNDREVSLASPDIPEYVGRRATMYQCACHVCILMMNSMYPIRYCTFAYSLLAGVLPAHSQC